MQSILNQIIVSLDEFSDPRRAEKSKTYFPTSQKVLGVSNPHIRSVMRELKGLYKEWSADKWIDLCKALVKKEIFECQLMAYEMLGRNSE